jgi:HEPN domain-containing protein
MDKIVGHWVERAQYDMETAKAMLECHRYLYVAYMCQQAIEKIIKAIIAQQGKENLPIHNLVRLSEIAQIRDELADDRLNFLAGLTPYHIEARYGDYKESLSEIINGDTAKELYNKTRVFFQWLYLKIK